MANPDLIKQVIAQDQAGVAAIKDKKYAEAAAIYQNLVAFDPRNPVFWSNLSVALRRMGHREAALGCIRRAVEIDPEHIDFLSNHVRTLLTLDRPAETIALLTAALKKHPDNSMLHRLHGLALRDALRHEESLAAILKAWALAPDDIENRWQKSVSYLLLGRYPDGWKDYDVRWERRNAKKDGYNAPFWSGQELNGKTILLYEEQGFGDTIHNARYIPLVKARGARVILGCRKPLHRLFQSIPGVDKFSDGGPLGETFQYHASLLDLPGIFGTEVTSVPPPPPLYAAPETPEAVNKLLEQGRHRLKVGIVWSGNTDFEENFRRAVKLSRFLQLAAMPGVQFYSLQKGAPEKEFTGTGADGLVLDLAPHLGDFADTAAVLKKLDLVIMTDSAVAHLAGSLGVPVWVLVHNNPFWPFMAAGESSPWYPSMRIFRQSTPGGWDEVFKNVAAALEKTARR